MSALVAPERVWWKPLGKDEKAWFIASLLWCLFMFSVMWWWPLVGEQNTPMESYRVDPKLFQQRAEAFVARYQVGELNGTPVVRPPAGEDVYLLARTFQFQPVLELQKGQTYRILLSSIDMEHGFSLQPLNMNFQVLPGYVYVLHLTPQEAGEYSLVCNEYCGLGHHLMTGKIIVRE